MRGKRGYNSRLSFTDDYKYVGRAKKVYARKKRAKPSLSPRVQKKSNPTGRVYKRSTAASRSAAAKKGWVTRRRNARR